MVAMGSVYREIWAKTRLDCAIRMKTSVWPEWVISQRKRLGRVKLSQATPSDWRIPHGAGSVHFIGRSWISSVSSVSSLILNFCRYLAAHMALGLEFNLVS